LDLQLWEARDHRRLLILDRDPRQRRALSELLGGDGVEVQALASLDEALALLVRERFHCGVFKLGSLKELGFLSALPGLAPDMPLILYCDRPLDAHEKLALEQHARAFPLRWVESADRLLLETCVYLHRPDSTLSSAQLHKLAEELPRASSLAGVSVLIIDDDVRNIFAMTSALERQGARITYADNGREGLALLDQEQAVHAVLVDMMIPELDGYEVMRRIRGQSRYPSLPIIAVTAKAMPSDREKCIAAGATHYISKPVDPQSLVAALRVATARER
jgi:hypothetical protein